LATVPEIEVGAVENSIGAEISDAEGREEVELCAVVVHSAEAVNQSEEAIVLFLLGAHCGVHMSQIFPHVRRDRIHRHVVERFIPSGAVVHAAFPWMQRRYETRAVRISGSLEPSVPCQKLGKKLLGFLHR